MTLQDTLALVGTIRYKPGWTIRARAHHQFPNYYPGTMGGMPDTVIFEIRARVPDAARPGLTTSVEMDHMLHAHDLSSMDEGTVVDFVYHWVLDAEVHEAGEFFTVGTRRPYDPHRGEKKPC